MPDDITVKKPVELEETGDVRLEFNIGRRSRLYRHWDENDDYYDDEYESSVPGLLFDMAKTALAQHRHNLRKKEEQEAPIQETTPDEKDD